VMVEKDPNYVAPKETPVAPAKTAPVKTTPAKTPVKTTPVKKQ